MLRADAARCSHSGHHGGCVLVALHVPRVEHEVSVGHSEAAEKEEVRRTKQDEVDLCEWTNQILTQLRMIYNFG